MSVAGGHQGMLVRVYWNEACTDVSKIVEIDKKGRLFQTEWSE